jgi:pimeloyl-ACP methyl ester carboxylesterase
MKMRFGYSILILLGLLKQNEHAATIFFATTLETNLMKKQAQSPTFETVQFKSKDGLLITGDLYAIKKPKGFILLCHRSHCNRGEYRETAPKLNRLGFSCLAIDQRSGMRVFGVVNETSALAKQKGLPTGFLDAKQDIEVAVNYAYKLNKSQPIILLGSSYSASLALWISTDNQKVAAVVTFSPGEYLKGVSVAEEIKTLSKPVFATGSSKEIEAVAMTLRLIPRQHLSFFKPKVEGFHGSKTLWESVKGYETFWRALKQFLSNLHQQKLQGDA